MVSTTLIQNSNCSTRQGREKTDNGERADRARSGSREGRGGEGAGLTEQQPWRRQTPRGGSRTEHRSSRHRQQHPISSPSSSCGRPVGDSLPRILGRCSARSLASGSSEMGNERLWLFLLVERKGLETHYATTARGGMACKVNQVLRVSLEVFRSS
jgi:hypothetical protein